MYDYILFDLDGTLSDTSEGVTKGVQIALRAFGIEAELKDLTCFIGPPLVYSFTHFYDFDEAQCDKAIEIYREYYLGGGLYENRPYDGLNELLDKIRADGKKLAVTTSKLESAAIDVLERNGLARHFDMICGATADGRITTKKEVLEEFFVRTGNPDKKKVVLIGDTHFDAQGAADVGIECIGVLYGFGTREELAACGVNKIAETVEDIYAML
ncbi:phosphoglycolate phosphatase [Ruminococcaceae bacterium YRB3002]|nr:phosphoglycolate phosphatase [Ruminococcaceae bacterium YRB3002]